MKCSELTWQDINTLERIINNVHYEFRNGIGEKSFGEEVLNRFLETKDEGSSEKPNNHFYGIGAIRNGVQEKIDWFRSRPYFDEKSDYSKGFLDALVEMRSLVNRPDFDNPEGLDEAAVTYIEHTCDSAGHPGWDWETRDVFDAFKAGAVWDRNQMMKGAKP